MPHQPNRTHELSPITIWAAMLAAAALLTGLLFWLWRVRIHASNIQPIHIDLSFMRPPLTPAAPSPVPVPYPAQLPIEPKPQPVPQSVPAAEAVTVQTDDLTRLIGVGPKIAGVLNAAGINTYTRLAQTDPQALLGILQTAGLRLADPASWPEQARLAAAGQWDEMKAYVAQMRAARN